MLTTHLMLTNSEPTLNDNKLFNQIIEEENALLDSMNGNDMQINEIDQYLNAFFQSEHNQKRDESSTLVADGEDSGFITCNSSMSSPLSSPMSTSTYSSTSSSMFDDRTSLSFQGIANSSNWNLTNLDQNAAIMNDDQIKLFSQYSSQQPLRHIELKIVKQPESHHRARYMTEGSRGTIKDSSGRGYPVVQLIGYNQSPVKLQCFIGHDQKIGEPHLFYQACEVSGKTPYKFVRNNGVNMIELEMTPKNNMQVVIDCIGILKERNVDVERKVLRNRRKTSKPAVSASEEARMIRTTNKKRSSHCRLVFRCSLPETGDILQACSDPILCTQPLGTPEIYKMSLREADMKGGQELYVIGKNFHKDSKVLFECGKHWRRAVTPHKDFLNSTHLICQIPAFDGIESKTLPIVNVDVSVHCNHKASDPMRLTYTNNTNNHSYI